MTSFAIIFGLALATALVLPRIGSQVWQRYRASSYQRNEDPAVAAPISIPDLAILQRTLTQQQEGTRKGATDLLDEYHKRGIQAQDEYHVAVSTGVTSILLGFLGLAAAVTVAQTSDLALQFTTALDVSCFGIALISFWRAIYFNALWIKARARNELLRQWCTIDNLLVSPPVSQDVTSRFGDFARTVDSVLGAQDPSFLRTISALFAAARVSTPHDISGASALEVKLDLASRVAEFWRMRRSELRKQLLSTPIASARLATHFKKRPITQAGWFGGSLRRLADQTRWRSAALLWAFIITVGLAAAKLAMVFHATPDSWFVAKPYLSLAILTTIGISSMLTALYLNQNARSLSHRYRAQERRIHSWISSYHTTLATLHDADMLLGPPGIAERLVDEILDFEDLMVDELVDWISISEDDIMELAP